MAQKNKDIHTINSGTKGVVQIADEVISVIAALAATEVDGVYSLAGGVTYDKASRAGARALSRGVRTVIEGKTVSVRLVLIMKYDYSIPETTAKVQERVKSALENMTGLSVSHVDVSIADVQIDSDAE